MALTVATALWSAASILAPTAVAQTSHARVHARSDLVDSAARGDLETVRTLLAGGADPTAARGDGITALHSAAQRGHADVARALLAAGADVDAGTRIGHYTPLHLASRRGHTAVALVLLDAGADAGAVTTASGASVLHLAAAAPLGEDVVRLLLARGADPNAREVSAGQTPLMFAAAADRPEAIRVLLGHGADPSVQTEVVDVLQHVTADGGADRILQRTLQSMRAEDGGGPEWTPDAAQIQEAIEAQRDFLRSGEAYGAYDPEALVALRADYPGGPPLRRPPYRESLVGMTGGMTALLHAAREGHVAAVDALLDGGADIDQVSGGDRTSPLLIATLNGRFDVALRLIERGADPDLAAMSDGATPLFATLNTQWAPRSNYPQQRGHERQETEYLEVLGALLAAGADPDPRLRTHLWYWEYGLTKIGTDLAGATPFWRAAYAQDLTAMRMLAEHGADPTIPTTWPAPGMRERRQQDGRQQEDSGLPTIPGGAFNAHPIHAAAGGGFTGLGSFSIRNVPGGFIPAVRYLVEEQGIDVDTRDSWGYTPMHYAASRGDNDLVEYLVSRGADVTAVTRLGQSTADMARGGRAGFFTRVAFPETVELLQSLGSTLECLHTHFLDTGDSCPLAGVDDPWAVPADVTPPGRGPGGDEGSRPDTPSPGSGSRSP